VHVSELRDERVENPRDVVKEGDELDVRSSTWTRTSARLRSR